MSWCLSTISKKESWAWLAANSYMKKLSSFDKHCFQDLKFFLMKWYIFWVTVILSRDKQFQMWCRRKGWIQRRNLVRELEKIKEHVTWGWLLLSEFVAPRKWKIQGILGPRIMEPELECKWLASICYMERPCSTWGWAKKIVHLHCEDPGKGYSGETF